MLRNTAADKKFKIKKRLQNGDLFPYAHTHTHTTTIGIPYVLIASKINTLAIYYLYYNHDVQRFIDRIFSHIINLIINKYIFIYQMIRYEVGRFHHCVRTLQYVSGHKPSDYVFFSLLLLLIEFLI